MQKTFIGSKVVDEIPSEIKEKLPNEKLQQLEANRKPGEGGSTTRAGVASRDPRDFDTSGRGGQGNARPQADPVI